MNCAGNELMPSWKAALPLLLCLKANQQRCHQATDNGQWPIHLDLLRNILIRVASLEPGA